MARRDRTPVDVRYETTPGVWLQVDPDRGCCGGAVLDVATTNAGRVSLFSAVTLDPTASKSKVELPLVAAVALRDALTRAIVHQAEATGQRADRERAILAVQEALPRVTS